MTLKTESITRTGGRVTVSKNIYVAGDGKTVVEPTDKRVAFLKYSIGSQVTEAQYGALIFPELGPEPLADAEQRSAAPQDSEKRRKRA
jgi:hypothetical protein